MAERHKREAKLNRGRKAKNKGREVLPNTKKSTSTEVIKIGRASCRERV